MRASTEITFSGSLPETYERFLVTPLFRPFADALLDLAALTASDTLLDVACGTGIVLRCAKERSAGARRMVGVDASPAMLAVAKRVAPADDWRQGDATELPVSGETFDLVTCHQGLQFFSDKRRAVSEMRRVLAPSGRLALGTWAPVDQIPVMRELHRIAERHLGPFVDQRHSFGDADALTHLLVEAGFTGVHVRAVTRSVQVGAIAVFPRLNAMAVVGMHSGAKALSDEQRGRLVAAIAEEGIDELQPYAANGDLTFELSSNVAIARP
jgi:ubiquinone/menaquinone biosynthesis C-methylase UbiE